MARMKLAQNHVGHRSGMPTSSTIKNSNEAYVSQHEHPVGYQTVGEQMAAKIELLYSDIKRFLAVERTLTPTRIAKMCGLASPWIVRDIRKPDWHVQNVAQLFRIEATLSKHPSWAPKNVLGEADRGYGESFIYRRWVDPYESPEFRKLALLWSVRRSDADFLDGIKHDPWVTILTTKGLAASEFRIEKYARSMNSRFALDKSGTRLSDYPSSTYRDLTVSDFQFVNEGNEPLCKDVVHVNHALGYRSVFRSIAFPCHEEGKIISKMKMEMCRPGRLTFGKSQASDGDEQIDQQSIGFPFEKNPFSLMLESKTSYSVATRRPMAPDPASSNWNTRHGPQRPGLSCRRPKNGRAGRSFILGHWPLGATR